MASIYKLPSGLWRAQIARRGVRKSLTFATKAAASAWAAREEAGILDGKASRWPDKTLRQALERYQREVSPSKGSQVFEGVVIRTTIRDFPELAAMPLHAITTQDLAHWRDKRVQEVSGSTVVRYAAMLRNVWTVAAREWGWCAEPSPWRALKLPAHNPPRERVPSWREVRAVLRRLNYITGRSPDTIMGQVAYAWLISLRTGMRASEVRSIRPETTDLDARVITLPHHKTAHITGRARRVPITKQAARLVALCPSFTVTARSLDAVFRKARDHAGLDGFTFHDGRALALTLLSRRVDVLTLARISGHRDLRVLLGSYYREADSSIAARL
jgi:integrase